MTEKPSVDGLEPADNVHHLPKRRKPLSKQEALFHEFDRSIAGHFREQNQQLQNLNQDLAEKIQRLTNGVERLVAEMHGIRTGDKEEAFARVGPTGAAPDLPTVAGEAALHYIFTAAQIGQKLGFHASQIGLLFSDKGLKWAGKGEYQEIGRTTKPSQSKFWHLEVPDRLRKVLDENQPAKYGITNKAVLTIFRKWGERRQNEEMLETLRPSENPH